jgi:hypothetical protein
MPSADKDIALLPQPTADCVNWIRRFISESGSRTDPAV